MARNLISPASINNLKPKKGCKLTKYHDGEGLYLWVYDDTKKNYKRWFFSCRFSGINKPEILLGSYSDMSIAEVRIEADKMRELLKNGLDPAIERKKEKTVLNFELVARDWWKTIMTTKSESYSKRVLVSLENDVFPFIGKSIITEIKPPEPMSLS